MRPLFRLATFLAAALCGTATFAALPDVSGTYACTGQDASEGAYTSTVTLTRVPAQSTARFSAYGFRMDVPRFGTYLGHAAFDGRQMAIHFALTDPAPKDFGTGLATFSRGKGGASGRWSFTKWYYEPEFKGGNHGTEQCTQR